MKDNYVIYTINKKETYKSDDVIILDDVDDFIMFNDVDYKTIERMTDDEKYELLAAEDFIEWNYVLTKACKIMSSIKDDVKKCQLISDYFRFYRSFEKSYQPLIETLRTVQSKELQKQCAVGFFKYVVGPEYNNELKAVKKALENFISFFENENELRERLNDNEIEFLEKFGIIQKSFQDFIRQSFDTTQLIKKA